MTTAGKEAGKEAGDGAGARGCLGALDAKRLLRWPADVSRPVRATLAAHPLRWALGTALLFVAIPALDLGVASLPFDPQTQSFPTSQDQPWRFLLKGSTWLVYGLLIFLALVWLAERLLRLGDRWIDSRILAYLWGSFLLGPGLIVNLIFKEHWGRARPREITAFGGEAHYSPPFLMADQCASNCSFPSGHAALGFWTLALALLAPERWRPWAVTLALAVGVGVGGARIVLGAHFLSDTLVSGVLVISLNMWLYRRLVAPGEAGFWPFGGSKQQ